MTLLNYCAKKGITVYDSAVNCSAELDGSYFIGLKEGTERDRTVALAHELGHIETNAFYNPLCPCQSVGQCEAKARKWALKKLLPEQELIKAIREGCTETWQLAERFNVTEDFIREM